MSFTPPDIPFSTDDIQTMTDVRRTLWANGARGWVVGSLSGYVLHTMARIGDQRQWWTRKSILSSSPTPKFTPNTAVLSFLLGGALGSYIMAVTAGKNSAHRMHDIFEIGAKSKGNNNNNNSNLSPGA
jgi:hypothetical protein